MKKADIITRICVFLGAPMIGFIGGIITGFSMMIGCIHAAFTGDIHLDFFEDDEE